MISFPPNPSLGDLYDYNEVRYVYDDSPGHWRVVAPGAMLYSTTQEINDGDIGYNLISPAGLQASDQLKDLNISSQGLGSEAFGKGETLDLSGAGAGISVGSSPAGWTLNLMNGTTLAAGFIQLSDDPNEASDQKAATAARVKALADELGGGLPVEYMLKTYVSGAYNNYRERVTTIRWASPDGMTTDGTGYQTEQGRYRWLTGTPDFRTTAFNIPFFGDPYSVIGNFCHNGQGYVFTLSATSISSTGMRFWYDIHRSSGGTDSYFVDWSVNGAAKALV